MGRCHWSSGTGSRHNGGRRNGRHQPRRANRGQSGPNLAPQGPPRTSEVPERTFYGQNGPFLPLFDRFLKLGGSIWTITVLDEQSIPLRCSGHPTSLYFKKKFPHKIGPWKFRASGHFGPNGALLGPPGAQERPDTRSKCVVTMCPTQADQSGAVGTKSGPPGLLFIQRSKLMKKFYLPVDKIFSSTGR